MQIAEKRRFLIEGLIYAFISLVIGILFLVIDWNSLFKIIFIIVGILVVVFNIFPFIESIKNLKYKTQIAISQFISSLFRIICGILLIFFQDTLTIVVSIIMLLFSAIDIFIAKENWIQKFKQQLPAIVISVMLLFFGFNSIANLIFSIFGWIFITISILIIVLTIIKYIKIGKETKNV